MHVLTFISPPIIIWSSFSTHHHLVFTLSLPLSAPSLSTPPCTISPNPNPILSAHSQPRPHIICTQPAPPPYYLHTVSPAPILSAQSVPSTYLHTVSPAHILSAHIQPRPHFNCTQSVPPPAPILSAHRHYCPSVKRADFTTNDPFPSSSPSFPSRHCWINRLK